MLPKKSKLIVFNYKEIFLS